MKPKSGAGGGPLSHCRKYDTAGWSLWPKNGHGHLHSTILKDKETGKKKMWIWETWSKYTISCSSPPACVKFPLEFLMGVDWVPCTITIDDHFHGLSWNVRLPWEGVYHLQKLQAIINSIHQDVIKILEWQRNNNVEDKQYFLKMKTQCNEKGLAVPAKDTHWEVLWDFWRYSTC